jgi:hypothetical protein
VIVVLAFAAVARHVASARIDGPAPERRSSPRESFSDARMTWLLST